MFAPYSLPPLAGETVAILAATARDAGLARDTLQRAAWHGEVVGDATQLADILPRSGALLLAEEACTPAVLQGLNVFLASQPVWSDLPILFLRPARAAKSENGDGFERISKLIPGGNLSILERPLRRATLVAATEFALKARARQYLQRDLIAEKEREVARRDEFLAMLGHELRNPLAAIGYAVELLDLLDEGEAAPTKTPREVIARQTRTLSRLVDDLLDVARVTRGKIALDMQPVDLNEVARRTLSSLEVAQKSADHDIAFSPHSAPLEVEGDPVRLEQVLSNLLFNAIKYTPRGGRIEICLEVADDAARVAVRDNGIGMDAHLLPRVFDLFSQSEQAIDRARGGLGIGLTLVQGLVKLHGGQVAAHSEGVGRGSTFEVRLPLRVAKRPNAEAAIPPEPATPRRVVVVEDNDDARELVCLLLRRDGHSVEAAGDGQSGLELILQTRPDAAFVDVGLPLLDGYEVAAAARAALGHSIRLIAVTGYGQPEDARRAHDAGFDSHLTKPVAHTALRAALAAGK